MKISKLLTEHKSGICFLLILQDKRLASASYDGFIIIYELSNFIPQIKIPAHLDWIISLNQLKNGYIVSCSRDASFKIWEIGLTTYKLITTVFGHTSCTDVLIELSNGDYASCSFDKSIKIWRANNEMEFKCIKTITYNDALKKLIEIQKCLVNNVFDHSIHFWSIDDYKEVGVIKNIDCWSTNGMTIISPIKFIVGGYKFLHIINAKTKQLESQILAHDDIIWSVCLLKDGTLLSGGNDKCIRQWDLVNLKNISEKKKAHENGIITILELPDGRIATGSLEQKEIKIWK
jgi:WD40 repeat protein